MKLTTTEARIGHAPTQAECNLNKIIRFDEHLLMGLDQSLVDSIISSGGILPDDLATKIASESCSYYTVGHCTLHRRDCAK